MMLTLILVSLAAGGLSLLLSQADYRKQFLDAPRGYLCFDTDGEICNYDRLPYWDHNILYHWDEFYPSKTVCVMCGINTDKGREYCGIRCVKEALAGVQRRFLYASELKAWKGEI